MLLKYIFNCCYAWAMLVGGLLYLPKILTRRRYLHRWTERLGCLRVRRHPVRPVCRAGHGTGRRVWFLASSVGEVNALRLLVPPLKQRFPDMDVVITTETRGGREQAKKFFSEHASGYSPLDFSWCVEKAMNRVRPDLIVLMELELWPNFVMAAEDRKIPVIIVNGRITSRTSRRYGLVRPLIRRVFRGVSMICSQNDTYDRRFASFGVPKERRTITGNIKYDPAIFQNAPGPHLDWFCSKAGTFVVIGGSTHAPEEEMLVQVTRRLREAGHPCCLILAPRHLDRLPEVEGILRQNGFAHRRRSQCSVRQPWTASGDDVLLLDTFGELSQLYSIGSAVFVGGTIGSRGGQNPVEAARWGKPLLGGKNFSNFHDVAQVLVEEKILITVENSEELYRELSFLLTHSEALQLSEKQSRKVLSRWSGSLERTVEHIETYLKPLKPERRAIG